MSPEASPREKCALALRVYRAFLRVAPRVHRRPLPELVAMLGVAPASPAPSVPAARISRAVDRCLVVLPVRPRCITLSLVMYRLLVEQGERPELVIGLEPGAPDHRAHAWVELDGRDVGPPPGCDGHEPMGRFA